MLLIIAAIGASLLLLWYKLSHYGSTLSALPGPPPTPFVGNALQIDKVCPFVSLHNFAKKYGSLFRLRIFQKDVVVVNDFESIYHVLVKKSADFDGRPIDFRLNYIFKQNDIAFADTGPALKGRRKVVQKFMKQFGSGIKRIEEITITASTELITTLADTNSMACDISEIFSDCITDLITILLFGNTVNKDDSKYLKEGLDTLIQAVGNDSDGQLLDMFPFLRYFGNQRFKSLQKSDDIIDKYITAWIANKPEVGFINHMVSMPKEDQQACYISQHKEQVALAFEFFFAGIITTSSTITFLANVLCHYPAIQEKLQKEVSIEIGRSRPPTMADHGRMPYHKATLLEIGRFASIAPFAIPHQTTKATHINNYAIPKGVDVWVNLWTMHHCEKFWDEPFEFRPERYLDDDGNVVPADHPNRKHTMPFGAGNRVCVGEIFAQNRMFLFLARIMQEFTILPETTVENQPSCDPRYIISGMVNSSPPFKVRFQLR